MKKIELFLILLLLSLTQGRLAAQTAERDSMDVLHYDITLDMGRRVEKQVQGVAEITFVLTKNCDAVTFDLICDGVSPVSLDGTVTRGFSYDRDNALLRIYLSGGQAGDTHVVSVPYVTNGYVESYGWGGLHMDSRIYYNLGVAFLAHPHVYGRAWFPCRDNFYDKATYRLTVTSQPGWRAICGGVKVSEVTNDDGSNTSVWRIEQPTPTYLASVTSAPWHVIEREFEGLYGTYPATIGYMSRDSSQVYATFDILEDVIPMYERAFGPYRWERVGYVGTPKGSMEHVSNIGLVDACIASTENACQMTMCHELGHAWFGNLLTCSTEGDMWINEGGASFCEEVAAEAAFGRTAATQYYLDNLKEVILSAHISDAGYRSLSGMSPNYTYGSTTYDKGALVWHSLRGLMGDSLFYSCMNRLFDRCAFGNIDAADLRDSLSLYSGMDLEGFFDFHVFTPGFVDFEVEGLQATAAGEATITLRQHLRGTDHYAHGMLVPVTFFGQGGSEQSDQWMWVDDSVTTETFTLPFAAAFAVVDYHNRIAFAATRNSVILNHTGSYDMDNTYCKVYVGQDATIATDHRVFVIHHFTQPTGEVAEGIVRLSNRYWEVKNSPWDPSVSLRLMYNMGSNSSSGAAFLDHGFFDKRSTLDSLCVVYRQSAEHPWQLVSRKRTSSSITSTGYFTTTLLDGQYALAVADSSIVGIAPTMTAGGTERLKLYPNPSKEGTLRVEVTGEEKNFDVLFFDASGKKVLQMSDVKSGDTVRHNLPSGSYVVIIKNNFISLQSQIIVQ
ncbi:MAG: T9SS type A sorting domain-containing protein [Bacteroidales bacterium]|nr:T9SS type A sorting domain-containing protein [Bacteroidales bacterium]